MRSKGGGAAMKGRLLIWKDCVSIGREKSYGYKRTNYRRQRFFGDYVNTADFDDSRHTRRGHEHAAMVVREYQANVGH